MPVLDLLPFLPPGLSPSPFLALLPTLLGILALLALLLFVVGARSTLAALAALPQTVTDVLHAWRRPAHNVLPTTDPSARSTAHPGPPTTLRGRGRARSKPGRRGLFGIGLNLGRRAKSLGPVLPRFNPASQRGGASGIGGGTRGSAPASPGLRVPLLEGDADAVPLVDLSGSWGSFSSASLDGEASGSGSNSASHTEYADGGKGKSPAPAHEVLIDVSHSHEEDQEYELVDVSVPPSPAAWALAHPSPAGSSFPVSPAASSSFVNSNTSTPAEASTSTSTTPRRLPEAMNVNVPPAHVPLANAKTKESEPHQLPSPPQSPPPPTARPRAFQVPAIPVAAAVVSGPTAYREERLGHKDEERGEEAPLTARPHAAEAHRRVEGEGDVELVQLEAPVTLAVEEVEECSPFFNAMDDPRMQLEVGEAPVTLELELPARPTAEELALASALLVAEDVAFPLPTANAIDAIVEGMRVSEPAPLPAPALLVAEDVAFPLPTANAIDAVVEGMHTVPAAPTEVPVRLVAEDVPLPLPTAHAIDAVVEGMRTSEPAPAPVPEPLVAEDTPTTLPLPLPTATAIDAVVEGMRVSEPAPAPAPASVSLISEPAPELPLPTALAIDAVVEGMHALEPAPVPAPVPLVAEGVPTQLPLPTANAIDAVVEGMHALEEVDAAPAPAYDDLPSPLVSFAQEDSVPFEVEERVEEVGEVEVTGIEVDALPSARAIDVLVEEMHARAVPPPSSTFSASPDSAASFPTSDESTLAPLVGVQSTPSLPAYSPGGYAYVASTPVLVPRMLFPRAIEDAQGGDEAHEDGEQAEAEQGEEEWDGEGAWDGEVRPLEEVLAAVRGRVSADEEGEEEGGEGEGEGEGEDPEEMALPSMPLPLPARDVYVELGGGGEAENDAEEEDEEEADPEDLPLPSMPIPTPARWTPPAGFSAADLWGAPPPPADDGDVEELVLDGGVSERDEGEDEREREDEEEREEDVESEGEAADEDVEEEEEQEQEEAAPLLLHIDTTTASLGPEDEREQDLASSTLSTLSSSEGVEVEGTRVMLRSASPVLLRPDSRATPRPDSRSTATSDAYQDAEDEDEGEEEEEEVDLGVVPARKPAWSRRAAAAPALGLPSSTRVEREREREEWVPGAFPASASFATTSFPSASPPTPSSALSPSTPSTSLPSSEKGANKENAGAKSTAVEPTPKRAGLRHRSPLDAALAMQLRPGMGVGADGAWLVRFLMSFFGWFAVLVAGGREFN